MPLVLVISCVFIIKFLILVINNKSAKPEFKLESNLLTDAEFKFFTFLVNNLDSDSFHIAIKVRLADVFKCVSIGKSFYKGFNRIKAKHFDFVIVSKKESKILLAIELDDSSHSEAKAFVNDKFKDDVCNATGLKLIRVPVSNSYNEQTLALFNI